MLFLLWFPDEDVLNVRAFNSIGQQFAVFAEKKGNCGEERVNTDNKKHTHKNQNNKMLNNFEILCQQTSLNRLCHTFDANEWLQWQWQWWCVCWFCFLSILLFILFISPIDWPAHSLPDSTAYEWVWVSVTHISSNVRKKRQSNFNLIHAKSTGEQQWFVFHWLVFC